MSENTTTTAPPATTPQPAPAPPADQPTEPHGTVTDWAAEARKWEQRAKDNADKAKKYDTLDAARQKTEAELAAERDTLKGDLTKSQLAELRLDVALAKAPDGTTPAKIRALAKRLTGSTREELEADVVSLIEEFGITGSTRPPSFDGGTRLPPPATDGDMNAFLSRAAHRG